MSIDEARLLAIAKHHLNAAKRYDPYANFDGVDTKDEFINLISNDPAFANVGFANEKYVIARIGGNLITSLHRKLGDMYEEMFQYMLSAKFGVSEEDISFSVEVPIGGRLQTRSTDGLLRKVRFGRLKLPSLAGQWSTSDGIAFELRSCYQIGDSKRIQADWDMALALKAQNLTPVMLITCATSLRSPVARLRRSWNLYEGQQTFDFIRELTDFDLYDFMKRNKTTISKPVKEIMEQL